MGTLWLTLSLEAIPANMTEPSDFSHRAAECKARIAQRYQTFDGHGASNQESLDALDKLVGCCDGFL